MNKTTLYVSALALLLSGCALLAGEDEEAEIVFGEHIEGIEIGDDSSEVARKLGPPPSQAYGDFDGWIFVYDEGRLERTEITIWRQTTPSPGVSEVSVYAPYEGKTKEGVGIGTPRNSALEKLGPPDASRETDEEIRDAYVFEGRRFVVAYRGGAVYAIHMQRR